MNKRIGMFSYDLLGYALMALSTFFVGLTIEVKSKPDKCLKGLLLVHGIFFISCLVMPILGLFSTDMQGAYWIGVAVLEFCCFENDRQPTMFAAIVT